MLDLHQVAQISTQGVLNSMAAGLAIALFAGLLLKVLGRRNSRTRFAVWFSALLAIMLLPLFNLTPDHPAVSGTAAAITVPGSWAIYLLGAWAGISCVALLRVSIGIGHLVALRRGCTPLDLRRLDPVLQTTISEARSVRRVEVCVSGRLQVPIAIGFFKPVVVLPKWVLVELSTTELNAILLHELAHLCRWDDWTNLAQKVFRAILFFHPAVWWIESRLSVEREMACDEIVLAKTDARSYAECLVLLAEKNYMRRGLAMAQAAVHRAGQTAKRLAQILDVNRPAATLVSKPAVAMVVVFAAGCLAVAPHTPQILAFREQRPAVAAVHSAPHVSLSTLLHAENSAGKVIPASFTVPAQSSVKPVKKPAVDRPRSPMEERQEAMVRPACTGQPQPNGRAPQTTFVVMQTREQYSEAGPAGMVWTFTVWHVTVIQQDQPPTDPALRSKST